MNGLVGIRREDKNRFESRVPLIPNDIAALMRQTGARFIMQPSRIRVFSDDEYRRIGAEINEDISSSPLILAVKEIPLEHFHRNGTYVFFSHTIKGQPSGTKPPGNIILDTSTLMLKNNHTAIPSQKDSAAGISS